MSATAGLQPGHLFAGRYQIERLLKAGGMGAVYVAIHAQTYRRVALKLMDPSLVSNADARARFAQEARVATLIQSAHVVDVLDADVDEATGTPFLVMELLQGGDLSELLAQRGRLPPGEVVWLLTQAAKALDRAHASGIVHRDLKPENLYLARRDDEPPRVKILDFGIAKMMQGAAATSTRATGTVPYMAPEQTKTSGDIGPATDVWALGLVAYTLLTGRSYWLGQDVHQMYAEILIAPLASAIERASQVGVSLPADFDRWFFSCVCRDPAGRYARAGDAVAALASVMGVTHATPAPPAAGAFGGGATQFAPQYSTPNPSFPSSPHAPNFSSSPSSPNAPQSPSWSTPQPRAQTPFGVPTPLPAAAYTPPGAIPNYVTGRGPAGAGSTAQMSPEQVQGHVTTNAAVQAVIPLSPSATGADDAPNRAPLFIALAVVLGAFVVGGAYFATHTDASTTAAVTAPPKPEPHAAPSGKGTTKGMSEDSKGALREKIDALNPFLGTGSASLQRHEVTREEFAFYLQSLREKDREKAEPLSDWDADDTTSFDQATKKRPVVWVSLERAQKFCKAIGAAVPTKEQWAEALGSTYPWGAEWPKVMTGIAIAGGESAVVKDVESSERDKTSDGIFDLAGNVQEWTSSPVDGGMATLRGASVAMTADDAKTAITTDSNSQFTESGAGEGAKMDSFAGPRLGFRCLRTGK